LTLQQLIRSTAGRLQKARLHYGHGTDNARDEAAFLVLRGLGLPFDAPLGKAVGPARQQRVEALLRNRIEKRIPAAYLLNEAWLEGRRFYVDRRVIVPRSHIGGLLGGRLEPWLRGEPRRILDLCTGSGCLAVLAALAFPRAEVHGADLSADALEVARINVRRYRLQRRVRLIRSDLFDKLKGRYDLIVCNPPYVATRAMRRLPAEYRHEPGMALAAGRDGLDLVSRIIQGGAGRLEAGGMLVCEIGENRRAVERAHPKSGFIWPQMAAGSAVFIWEAPRTAGASRMPARPARARG
jgi:ribosomal protein L3 glutamine methyltransferase